MLLLLRMFRIVLVSKLLFFYDIAKAVVGCQASPWKRAKTVTHVSVTICRTQLVQRVVILTANELWPQLQGR